MMFELIYKCFLPQMESRSIKRHRNNFSSILVTTSLLFLALDVSSSVEITESSVRETVAPHDGPHYTDINGTANYKSDADYDPDGLEWLYNMTKDFMDLILDDAIPKDVITISGDNDISFDLSNHVSDVLGQYAYVVALVWIIVIFAMVMLVTGFCFTCYCCCCSCSSPNNGKKKNCRKITLISLLITCGAFITFGGVCAFIANNRLKDGIHTFPDDMRKSVEDAKTFLQVTDNQINTLLTDNFNEFSSWISDDIDESLRNVQQGVQDLINQMSVEDIFDTLSQFNNITEDAKNVISSIKSSMATAKSLQRVTKELANVLDKCPKDIQTKCDDQIGNINKLNVELPSMNILNEILEKIEGIPEIIGGAKAQFEKIQNKIDSNIGTTRKTANDQISNAGQTIKENVDKISSEIKNLETYLPKTTNTKKDDDSFLGKAQDFVDNYDSYRYLVGVAICCILFCIIGLLVVGMICGFGRVRFLNRTGNIFLLCGTTMMFYLTIAMAAITLIYFLVGVVMQQAVCKSLRNPSKSTFFDLVDQYNLSQIGLDSNFSKILQSIRHGESAYNVFNLQTKFDLDQVDGYLDEFKEALDNVNNLVDEFGLANFKMLPEDQINDLKNMISPDFSEVETFLGALVEHIKAEDITNIITSLENIAKLVKDENFVQTLKKDIADLKAIDIDKFLGIIPQLQEDVAQLERELKLGTDSFETGISNLVQNIDNAQTVLQEQGPTKIKEIVGDFTNKTFIFCKDYVDRVKNEIRYDVGNCKPLGVIYDATLTSVCDKVALQMNGVWFVLLWTMLLFLPTVIISSKLASLYKSEVPSKSTKAKAIRVPKWLRGQDAMKTETNYITPVGNNRNEDVLSRNLNHIALDKWEQYPPSVQDQNSSRSRDEYGTPPPYFFSEFNTGSNSLKVNDNKFDGLSRWEQYPEPMKKSTRF